MEQSPLVQQTRPDTLKPKIVELYESLFQGEQFLSEESEGFWREFFLLKPDTQSLFNIISAISPNDLLHSHELACQELFHRAIYHIRTSVPPSDSIALDTLTAFLEAVLSKTYTSPSSDLIAILSGLQDVDQVFSDFVTGLDQVIKDSERPHHVRIKAVQAASVAVAGAYRTGLMSYFVNRDMFPALVLLLQDCEIAVQGFPAFALLGLLTNYNKFEFQNPYRLKLEDLVDESIMSKITLCVGAVSVGCRDEYTYIQEDQPDGWNFGGTLQSIGLGVLTPRSQSPLNVLTDDQAAQALAALPPSRTMFLLPLYDLVNSNKLFGSRFVGFKPEGRHDPTPFANFLSFSSYLLQNAHRSPRASLYSCLCLVIFQIMVEDQNVAKALCNEENKITTRLCRQRHPFLPVVRSERIPIIVLLDVIVGGISHNIRKRLDVELYYLYLSVLLRILSYLSRTRTRLVYHWSELWRCLLSLLRFLSTYAADLSPLPSIDIVPDTLLHLLAFSIASGEAFLPDGNSYDDLFYKTFAELVNTAVPPAQSSESSVTSSPALDNTKTDPSAPGDLPSKLRIAYNLSARPGAQAYLDVITSVSRHYQGLLEEQRAKKGGGLGLPSLNFGFGFSSSSSGTGVNGTGSGTSSAGSDSKYLSAESVRQVIKQGYDTLDLRTREGIGAWERYREGENINLIKRVVRIAVADVRGIASIVPSSAASSSSSAVPGGVAFGLRR